MSQTAYTCPPETAEATCSVRAEAVAALHLLALRRQFGAIRAIFGDGAPHRSRESVWVALEVAVAELRGERIALRDLIARADGVLSGPTLSRVVAELEQKGFLQAEAAPNSRLKLLRPTARTLEILTQRAETAFAEFAGIISATEKRLAEATHPPAK